VLLADLADEVACVHGVADGGADDACAVCFAAAVDAYVEAVVRGVGLDDVDVAGESFGAQFGDGDVAAVGTQRLFRTKLIYYYDDSSHYYYS